MASTSREELPLALKRKRSSSIDFSELQDTEKPTEDSSNVPPKTPKKLQNRKRKFIFSDDKVVTKKMKKFYFINETGTKPRKPKLHSNENSQPSLLATKRCKTHSTKTDSNGNLFLTCNVQKYDPFFNNDKKYSYESFKKLDLAFHVFDEIALEGLDGITLEAFWKRLKCVFPNQINKVVAERVWRVICNNKRVNFLILKEPREELVLKNDHLYVDIYIEPYREFKDIYPFEPVLGADVKGSCSTFHTRKENNGVRKFSLDKALKLYDQRLVIVADQPLRNKSLKNDEADPNLELRDLEYCLLEKIGRYRGLGEFTQGKVSMHGESKKVYLQRKLLLQNLLIAQQPFCLRSFATQQNVTGNLIHLRRFYSKRKTKLFAVLEKMGEMLRTKPNHEMHMMEFKQALGVNIAYKHLFKSPTFRRFFKLVTVPYRKVFPNATRREYMQKSKIFEKQIRIVKMIDPNVNVSAVLDTSDTKPITEQKNEWCGHKLINFEFLKDIFLYILSCGTEGVSLLEINEYFKSDFYLVRVALSKLLQRNVLASKKIDCGRQQTQKYFAKCLTFYDCHIETTPHPHSLTEDTLKRILIGYDKPNLTFHDDEIVSPQFPPQIEFKLPFEPFCCPIFLTETVDACSEELTIYDIVVKGRDKLLLIQSNLFAHFMSEWDDLLLKREGFSKSFQIFRNGFGKIIYEFLSTVRLGDFETDNKLVFKLDSLSVHTKIAPFQIYKLTNVPKNVSCVYSDVCQFDVLSKAYLMVATLNSSHVSHKCVEKIKQIFEVMMKVENKRKRRVEEIVKTEPTKDETFFNPITEKFMGPNPILVWSENEDHVSIEIFESTPSDRIMEVGSLISDDLSLTKRYVNRTNSILRIVYDREIITDVATLYRDILKEEDDEGYDKKADKKTIISIITKLVSEGYIKCYKLVMTGKNLAKTQTFACLHSVNNNHDDIRAVIEQWKLKFYDSDKSKQIIKKSVEPPFNSDDVKESVSELKQLTNVSQNLRPKFNKFKGHIYGYAPKFVRMRALHELLFYLVRDLAPREPMSTRHVTDMLKQMKLHMTPDEILNLPPIYTNTNDWKMFVPSLSSQSSCPKGWTLASDVILRMPLSVFIQLHNVSYDITELEEFLRHPIKKHILVKHLPSSLRNILFNKRKYFNSIYETICNLCYVGLVQLGPRSLKEKSQIFLFLNSRGSLLDTCDSKPGYNLIEEKHYDCIQFELKTWSDLEMYWSEMLRICMGTQLGKRKILTGQTVTFEDCASKPSLMETLKTKSFKQAVKDDVGNIPGDHRGAAGFDSAICSFVKKNWNWSAKLQQKPVVKKESDLPEPIPFEEAVKLKQQVKKKARSKIQPKKRIWKIAPRKKKKNIREYYDAIDKSIMRKNPGIKVEWSDDEDQILTYMRTAMVFLANVKKQLICYTVFRDVLHRLHPKSKNKTARAIQRRLYVLLTNNNVLKSMENNVENLLNSETIAKYFEQIRNRSSLGIKVTEQQLKLAYVYLVNYIFKHRKEVELLLLGCFASCDFLSDANLKSFEEIVQACSEKSAIYQQPTTIEEITKDSIKSVIHCSLSCKKNSKGWAYHLSTIYKKFKDNLIREAISEMRRKQFLVQNRYTERKNWLIPIKFSQAYNFMKNCSYSVDTYKQAYVNFAKFLGKADLEFLDFMNFNELYSFWDEMSFVFDIPEMEIILNPEIEDHSEVVEELAKRLHLYLNQIHAKSIGIKKHDLASNEKDSKERKIESIKEEVRHLIFRVPYLLDGELEQNFKKMVDSSDNQKVNEYILLMFVELKKFAQSSCKNETLLKFVATIEDVDVKDEEKLMKNLSRAVFAIQSLHQSDTYEHLEESFKVWEKEIWGEVHGYGFEQKTKDAFLKKNYTSGLEKCTKRAQNGDFPTVEEIKVGMLDDSPSEDRCIPHITDLVMLLNEDRFPDLESDVETIERMKEHFVMQIPKLSDLAVDNLSVSKCDEAAKIVDDLKIGQTLKKCESVAESPLLDQVVNYITSQNGTATEVKMTEQLIDFIKSKKEFGAPGTEIKENFLSQFTINLVDLLNFLVDSYVILKTGVTSIVFVHYEYQSEWLIETSKLLLVDKETDAEFFGDKIQPMEPRTVQLKPWTKLDGSLNNGVFRDWLLAVLNRCMDFPNIPFPILCEHLHYIKPYDIYLLLEALKELGCVQIYVLTISENSLFSGRSLVYESEATCLDNFENFFVKTTSTAGLCFGSFVNKFSVIEE